MSWLSSIAGDVSNAFNSQPSWAKDLEIGGAAVAGGVGLAGLAGLGPAAGLFAGGDAAAGAGAGAGAVGGVGAEAAPAIWDVSGLAGGASGGASGGAGAVPWDVSGLPGGASGPSLSPEFQGIQLNAGGANAVAGQVGEAVGAGAPAAGGTAPAGAPLTDLTADAGNAAAQGGGTYYPPGSSPGAYAGEAAPGDVFNMQGSGISGSASAPPSGGFNLSSLVPSANSIPGAAIAAGGLGYSIYNQNKTEAGYQSQINAQQQQAQSNVAAAAAAAPTLQAGEAMMQYLQTGTLPPNVQTQLNQAVSAAKAKAIANAAQSGLSTDPTQNTALAQQLNSIDMNAQSQAGALEQQLFTSGQQAVSTANQLIASGLQSTQMTSQMQEYLINLDNQLSLQTGQAITKFAASLAPQGGAQKYTLQQAA